MPNVVVSCGFDPVGTRLYLFEPSNSTTKTKSGECTKQFGYATMENNG